ncbi:MAG: ABC transporter substrate-binding protein [Desertimonas sp.]
MQQFSRRTALALGVGAVVTAYGQSAIARVPRTTPTDPTDSTGGGSGATVGATDLPSLDDYDLDATYRYMYSVGPSRFDPHRGTSSFDNTSLFLVYDRLVMLDELANPIPGLATEWEFVDDGGALQLTLREGVTFHDGEPFDADAVKTNIERAQTVEGSAVSGELAVIESVEVVDDLTVRLNLAGPAAHLPLVLSDRAGMMVSPAAIDDPTLDQSPVGAGMFRVTEYRPDDRILMERHEGYWDAEAARCANFEFIINGDPITRLNAIRTDACDGTFIDPPQEGEAEGAGLQIVRSGSLAYYHLQLNRSFEPFANVDVRRALNHAVNREAIVEGLLLGLGAPACQTFPEGYVAFDEATGTDAYPYDPELAREMLADAGFESIEFECIVPTIPQISQLGEIVQAQLAEVGVSMSIRAVEPAQTADIFYAQQEGQGMVSTWGGRADPSQTLSLLFSAEGFSNPGRHTTDAVAEAIDATFVVQSPDERAAALQAASAAIAADALNVVLYYPITPSVFTERSIGMQTWLSGKPEFRAIGLAAS